MPPGLISFGRHIMMEIDNVGSFWWRDCCKLIPDLKNMAKCNISQGDTIHFWKDSWNETELELRFPQLYSYARDKEITVKKAYECIQDDIYDLFQLPLSAIALQ